MVSVQHCACAAPLPRLAASAAAAPRRYLYKGCSVARPRQPTPTTVLQRRATVTGLPRVGRARTVALVCDAECDAGGACGPLVHRGPAVPSRIHPRRTPRARTHTQTHIHTHTRARTRAHRAEPHKQTCTNTRTHAHTHTHARTCLRAHTHAHCSVAEARLKALDKAAWWEEALKYATVLDKPNVRRLVLRKPKSLRFAVRCLYRYGSAE